MRIRIKQKGIIGTLEINDIKNLTIGYELGKQTVAYDYKNKGQPTFEKFRLEDLEEFTVIIS